MNKYCVFLYSVILLVSGCAGYEKHDKNLKESKSVQEELQSFSIRSNAPAAVYIDAPQNDLIATPIERVPDWYYSDHNIQSAGLPFYYVAEEFGRRYGIFVKYGPDIDPNLAIHLVYENGSAHGALEALASATGMNYEVNGKYITWSLYQVERFDLSYVGGKFNYLIGGSESGGGNNETTSVTVGSNQNQFHNIESNEINVYQEVQESVEGILNDVGEVILSESSSSIIVRTTQARMERVKKYMDSLNDALAKQVVVEMKVLKVRTDSVAASGIDWNLVKTASNGTLSFGNSVAESSSSTLFGSAPTTITATKSGGSWDASSILLTALEEQGTVSVVTEPRVVTQVNRVAELEISELQGFIERTEVTPNADSDPSVSITPGTVRDGYTIFMLANVDSHDRIYLHMSSLLSDLLQIDRKEVGNNAIETPRFVENKFSQTVILNPGQTFVANGLKQVTSRSNAASPVGNDYVSSFKSGERFVEETIVLITPTILDMSR